MAATARNWFSITMLLLGIVLGGFAGVLRGDWLGKDAAQEVEIRIEKRLGEFREDMKEIKQDLKELLMRD